MIFDTDENQNCKLTLSKINPGPTASEKAVRHFMA